MRDALNATGRPIVYSMCEWGVSSPWFYGKKVRSPTCENMSAVLPGYTHALARSARALLRQVGHTWRTGKDISIAIEASWDGVMQARRCCSWLE